MSIRNGILTAEVEIDLDCYADEIIDYFEDDFKERFEEDDYTYELLLEYVKELEADIYRNYHKKERTIESIYNDLEDIIRKVGK